MSFLEWTGLKDREIPAGLNLQERIDWLGAESDRLARMSKRSLQISIYMLMLVVLLQIIAAVQS